MLILAISTSSKICSVALLEDDTKLKELNIRTGYRDVSVLDNIRKTRVSGRVRYYELNKGLL